MIEFLFPKKELEIVSPPRMDIGDFIVFKDYSKKHNPFGIGQQAVHNSGSSMLKDTPTFRVNVISFIEEHFKYSDTKYDDVNSFISLQVDNLVKFKKDKVYRNVVLSELFPKTPFVFDNSIKSDYLFISLVLFFVREYNFLKSTHKPHELTKSICKRYYKNEKELLKSFFDNLKSQNKIKYISDICYGRYYFLEVHFLEKNNPRNVPLSLSYEYLVIKNKNMDAFDLSEQKEIQAAKKLTNKALEILGNRKPEIGISSGSKKYKTNSRISKTVLENESYQCQVDPTHMTFYTKKEIIFSEAHHLIPMSFQESHLPINIDRKENIVSLCPTCHRAVHLGRIDEKEKRLKILFKNKTKGLNKVGLKLTFEDLIKLYD